MINPMNEYLCMQCGYDFASSPTDCPLCNGGWQGWELLFAPHALDDLRAQVMSWIGQLPFPAVVEWIASPKGLRVRLYIPPNIAEGVVHAWAAMTGQHSRWRALGPVDLRGSGYVLHPSNRLPSLIASAKDSDPILAIGSRLISAARDGKEMSLRLWLLGNEGQLQERLRALSSYSYGTEGGVENNTPNPWAMQLDLLRAMLFLGIIMAGLSAGIWSAGWFNPLPEILVLIAGGAICIASAWGIRNWLEWRSIPKEILEKRIQEPLLKVAMTLSAPIELPLFAGEQSWKTLSTIWPEIREHGFPLPASELAGLISPLQLELTPDLPHVLADEDRATQVLTNLVGNALQYTPEDGRITLSAKQVDDEVQIAVHDTDIGIPPEQLTHIFDRFYRVDKSRSRQSGGGSGIGLTIARSLVEAHGGRIWVESAGEGQGSIFAFTLPIEKK